MRNDFSKSRRDELRGPPSSRQTAEAQAAAFAERLRRLTLAVEDLDKH